MTLKQKLFAKRYIEIANGTQAALDVYDTKSANVASSIAYENLRKPEIEEEINRYFERENISSVSIAGVIKDSLDSENPIERLRAAELCLRIYGIH